jgi:hypothetical protein
MYDDLKDKRVEDSKKNLHVFRIHELSNQFSGS